MKKEISEIYDGIHDSYRPNLEAKLFVLDHTAEVLENYRRIEEYNIFKFEMHTERMKRTALRDEGYKKENLIANYEERFGEIGSQGRRYDISDFVQMLYVRNKDQFEGKYLEKILQFKEKRSPEVKENDKQ